IIMANPLSNHGVNLPDDEQIIMANPLPNHGVNLPDDEQVQPELVPALHGLVPGVLDIPNNNNGWIKEEPDGSSRKVFAPGPIGNNVDMLHRKVKGLSQQMFDRANTEYSTLKRLVEMD
nr:hypothetical protein [Tanacetum cinerariifolium]